MDWLRNYTLSKGGLCYVALIRNKAYRVLKQKVQ